MALFHYLYKLKKKSFFFNIKIILLFISCFLSNINSQEIPKKSIEIEKFNNTLFNFNNTKKYIDDISTKMKDITINILLRIRFRELKRFYNNIELKVLEMQKQLSKEKYNSTKIIDEIDLLDQNLNKLEKIYNKVKSLYYEYEQFKYSFFNFIKLFFIILSISVLIILCIIGIGSYFVVKNQRKYYKLKEEISFNSYQKQMNKKTNINRINEKDFIFGTEKTNEKLRTNKNNIGDIISTSEPNTQDEMKEKREIK